MNTLKRFITLSLLTCLGLISAHASSVTLFVDQFIPQTLFAVQEIRDALETKGYDFSTAALDQLQTDVPNHRIVLVKESNEQVLIKMGQQRRTLQPNVMYGSDK